MDSEKNTKNEGIVLQKKHIVIASAVICLLIAGGIVLGAVVGGSRNGTSSAPQTSQTGNPDIDLDPNAGTWEGSKPEEKGGASKGIKIPGYPSITIQADTENVRMALLNPEGNPCYFKFEIVLKENNKTIFESKYVEPGKAITDVELTEPLSEGEYPAVIKISTLSLDGKNPLNGANVETILIAK